MPQNLTIYRVLISSPSDVRSYAQEVAEVLKEWSSTDGRRQLVGIEPVMWETHAVPEMGDKPQNIINRQLVESCDLTVALFGTRFGTPTDNYGSGTAEEIELSLIQGKPVSIYFSHVLADPSSLDLDQYSKLQDFEKSCRSRGLYSSYDNIMQLRKQIRYHTPSRVVELHERHKKQNQLTIQPSTLPIGEPQSPEYIRTDKKPFVQLSKQEIRYWLAAGAKYLMSNGVQKFGDQAIKSAAEGLYRQSVRSTKDLQTEAMAAFGRKQKKNSDPLASLAARRLPNDDDATEKK